MPDMGYEAVKNVLRDVQKLCCSHDACCDCPLKTTLLGCCPMAESLYPEHWPVDAWEEDADEAD